MSGKGSKPRPFSISQEEFKNNWDQIFAKKAIAPVKTLDNGEQFIDLPQALMDRLGWEAGDEIIWAEQPDGSFELNKKSNKK